MAPSREELQQRIADLDRRINEEVAKTRLPELSTRHSSFPWANWILTALCFGWMQFGGMIPPVQSLHNSSAQWGLYAGLFFGVIAVLRTALWFIKSRRRSTKGYMEATTAVRALQDERRELQKQLQSLGAK